MRRLFFKVFMAVFAALMGVGLMMYQQEQMREEFEISARIDSELQTLHADIIALQHTVLEANYFLYYNNDVIYDKIRRIKEEIDTLLAMPHLANRHHGATMRKLLQIRQNFKLLAERIDDFLTLNASLKNSSIYLPTLALKAYDLLDIDNPREREIILTLSKINAGLFLAKNALDDSFVAELETYKKRLASLMGNVSASAKQRLLVASIRHLELFIDLFPRFHAQLNAILKPDIQQEVLAAMELFSKESATELGEVNRIGELLLMLYLLTLGIVIYFVFHSEKEYIRLKRTQEKLQKSLTTDPLTGLENRQAFTMRLRTMRHPALILVNIDRFKHINEFYGSEVGDHLLQAVASLLQNALPKERNARLFRLGGDDFGILLDCEKPEYLEKLIEEILARFDQETFIVDNLAIDISVSIGASLGKKLFETADMALKSVKSSRRKRYALYDPSLDVSETIANNIHALRQLKTAIANDAVIPYFQPIVDMRTGKVLKYEALARLQAGESEVITPFFFIEAAKQAKLSGVITTRILGRTLEVARKTGQVFSVNLSAEDIVGSHDRRQIFDLLAANDDVAGSIVFEILETEEIEDYEIVSDFIREVKRFGCRISIDDFGSGYSNFEKLLQLEIDIIKIDGSLIKNVDHDTHAELVVQTIVDFAKGAGLTTVAEFVHSQAVYEKVRVLGIDFAQGYHLGEPRPAEHYFKELKT
ncbi:EAL domain-containing protein [Hydrogenimonas sp.]